MNPLGLVFASGQAVSSDTPMQKVAPLAEKAVANLKTALRAAGSEPADTLRVTCFCSSLEDYPALRAAVETEYRQSALHFVQLQRDPCAAWWSARRSRGLSVKSRFPCNLRTRRGSPSRRIIAGIAAITFDGSGATVFQQTQNSPCVIGDDGAPTLHPRIDAAPDRNSTPIPRGYRS